MVIFIAAMLFFNTAALYFINRRLEERIIQQVEVNSQALTLASSIALKSLFSGEYIRKLVAQESKERRAAMSGTIRHILVIDAEGKIVDSTDEKDIEQQLQAAIGDLPPMSFGDVMGDTDASGNEQDRTMSYPVVTDKGERKIVIVLSISQLKRVVDKASLDRLVATGGLGVLSLLIIAFVSWRFTLPITALARAARRVTAGDLDFQVPVSRRDEVGALAETFNEMLAGLRSKRELEKKLQRAERSAVVGRLASGIAHEIRNPLNFINLSIDHLREKFAPAPPAPDAARAEYGRILGMIKDEIGRLNRMVSEFLSYGRPARLKLRDLDVRSLVEEVVGLVSAQAEQQGVRLTVQASGGEGGHRRPENQVRGDAEQLKTCFSNLVINAIQAMPEGGALVLTLHPRESEIEVEVADTGPGIAPEAIGQIFEPYYSTKETGIGLGLPLTKKIIDEHGGRITVKSELGAGTTFTVTLPRGPMGQPRPELSPQTALSAP